MVAEMELGFIRDRQRAGIEAAKAKGAARTFYILRLVEILGGFPL
jgi:DNA invertase Pin-like site-specific DNA recombinase